jgi:hypothetical protein
MATAPKIQYSEKYFDKEFEYRSGSTLLMRACTRLFAHRRPCGTDGRDCGVGRLCRHLPLRHPAADRRGRVRSLLADSLLHHPGVRLLPSAQTRGAASRGSAAGPKR